MSVPVKVYRNNEIRRFNLISGEGGSFNFQDLLQQVQSAFPNLDANSVRLTWKDNDGELITVSSSLELNEAIRGVPVENPVLRVHVIESIGTDSSNKQQDQPMQTNDDGVTEVDPTLHSNVFCNGCEGGVVGIRYKCLTCPDFDLCSNCTEKHDEHPMIRIVSPHDQTWRPAFLASQGYHSFVHGGNPFEHWHGHHGHGHGHGHGHKGKKCCKKDECKRTMEEEGQSQGEKQDKQGETQPPFFNEEFARNLTETIGTVLGAFGIPIPSDEPMPTSESQATASTNTGATVSAADGSAAAAAHPDPRIAAALNNMSAMGYKDDGGWLTRLLEEKRGNVSAVLDVLHPPNQQ